MVGTSRKRRIAFFIALGAGVISVVILLYVGWVLLNWRTGWLLFLGVLLMLAIIAGVVLNTIFLVREIRRNEQHDAFINSVTHELKTPVASIRLYLETLQKHPVDESKRQEFYRTMLQDSDRLLTTIEQVLRTGRVSPSRRKLNRSPIDMASLIGGCIDRVSKLYRVPAEGIRYQQESGAGPLTVLGDFEEVQAAVSNLIDNAVKYSAGHVDVTVRAISAEDGFVTVRVSDKGPGIPQEELKRIFKRFYRVPGQLAIRVKGTGLGLYIVRAVARRHGGRAWAESEGAGHGSTFVLQLPLLRSSG